MQPTPLCPLDLLPNEMVVYIVSLLMDGLATPNLYDNMNTDLLISFYNVQLVCKDMQEIVRDCLKRIQIDWHAVVGKMFRPSDEEGWPVLCSAESEGRETVIKMARTQLYCNAQLPLIRRELDAFRAEHKIVCKAPKRKGYISMKVLKRLKVDPKEMSDQYRGIIKSYEVTKKKERLLHRVLTPIRQRLKHAAFIKRLLFGAGQGVMAIILGHRVEM